MYEAISSIVTAARETLDALDVPHEPVPFSSEFRMIRVNSPRFLRIKDLTLNFLYYLVKADLVGR